MEQIVEETQEEVQAVNNQDKPTEEVAVSDKCYEDGKKKRVQKRTETRNKQAECKVCFRKMRSDNVKRHMLTHQKVFTVEKDKIRAEMKRRNKFLIERGKRIASLIIELNIPVRSLSRERRLALGLYRREKHREQCRTVYDKI